MDSEVDPEIGCGNQDSQFIRTYLKLPEKPTSTVRFFERPGFNNSPYYTVYGPDATLVARDHFQAMDKVKTLKLENSLLEYVCLSRSAFQAFCKYLLLVKQYRVEVFTEAGRSSSGQRWNLEYKGSPGNFCELEEIIFANADVTVGNAVVGIKISEHGMAKIVGVACVNINDCFLSLLEFEDNEHFCNLESVLVQVAAKEAIVCISGLHDNDTKRLFQVLDRNNLLVTESSSQDFDSKNINQDLANLMRPVAGRSFSFASHPDHNKKHAAMALTGTIKYLELLADDKFANQFSLEKFDVHLHVKMDAAACRALDLGLDEGRTSSGATLLGAIDKCRTPQGHRLLAKYLKQPLKDKEQLEERLDMVEAFVDDTVLRQTFYDDLLRRIPDCQMLARKLMRNRASLADYYKAYLFCTKLHLIQAAFQSYEGSKSAAIKANFCLPLDLLEEQIGIFCKEIENSLDLDAAEKGIFIIRADVDESLKELWSEMNSLEEKMSEETYEVAKLIQLEANKTLKLEQNNQHGHYFRITLKDEPAIRNNSTYKVIDSSKGGIRFRNKELENLSSLYSAKQQKYEEKQKVFFKELLQRCTQYCFMFESLSSMTAKLDVAVSFAVASVENAEPYIRPKLLDQGSGRIYFKDLRHPCVELQRNLTFIPNTIEFVKGDSSFYIITGPNMGGKSTLLRSVGVATLLAQIGCFVPASEAEVTIVDAILARVGAGDALQKGISTFMAEMLESSFILQTATSNSLVLIDELGRGTSTYDGFGLCWAISENMHFVAIPGDTGLQMMHRLEPGSCDRSFGIHVGRVAEFPPSVLQAAEEMAIRLEEISSNDKDDSVEGVSRREKERQIGCSYIDKFLGQIAELAEKCNDESSFQNELKTVLSQANSSELPYIQHLLTVCGKR